MHPAHQHTFAKLCVHVEMAYVLKRWFYYVLLQIMKKKKTYQQDVSVVQTEPKSQVLCLKAFLFKKKKHFYDYIYFYTSDYLLYLLIVRFFLNAGKYGLLLFQKLAYAWCLTWPSLIYFRLRTSHTTWGIHKNDSFHTF